MSLKKLLAEENLKEEKQKGRFIVFLIMAVIFLAVVRIILANRLVEASSTLRDLDTKINSLETDNQALSQEIRQKESLTLIEGQAQALGFVKTNKYSFITSAPSVALEPSQFSPLR